MQTEKKYFQERYKFSFKLQDSEFQENILKLETLKLETEKLFNKHPFFIEFFLLFCYIG